MACGYAKEVCDFFLPFNSDQNNVKIIEFYCMTMEILSDQFAGQNNPFYSKRAKKRRIVQKNKKFKERHISNRRPLTPCNRIHYHLHHGSNCVINGFFFYLILITSLEFNNLIHFIMGFYRPSLTWTQV